MRDPKRIKEFCDELAKIWENECPDYRFAQLICNIFGSIGYDPFYFEDDKMMDIIKRYFNIEE